MVNYLHISAIILGALSVAIADALIKKSVLGNTFMSSLKNPLMIAIVLLYLAQIFFFMYVFVNGWSLGIVGNLQMVFYSLGVISMGMLYFGETITILQGIGIILALIGVVLINS